MTAVFVGVLAIGVLWPGAVGTAAAQGGPGDLGDQVVISGRVHMASGERAGNVVVLHGPVTVDGLVTGSVVVFDGPATIRGQVRDNVVVFNGPLSVAARARIGGDVLSRRRPSVAPGAVVQGQVRRLRAEMGAPYLRFGAKLAVWLAYSFSVLVLGLVLLGVAPRALEAVSQESRRSVGSAIGWGLLVFFGVPILAIIALVTVVGIPLGLGLLLALWLLYTIGYTVGAWILGRAVVRPPRSRFVAFLAGWAILRAAALVPFLAGFLWLAAAVFGLGCLTVSLWRARSPATVPPPPVGSVAAAA